MRRPLLVIVVVALASIIACKKVTSTDPSPPFASPPASTADLDALWAMAPDGAVAGFVVSARGVGMLEHAWQDVHAFMKAAPELAPVAREMEQQLQKAFGKPELALADVGLTATKGAALFLVGDKKRGVAIVPLGDREKLVTTAKGRHDGDVDRFADNTVCKPVGAMYACADSEATFLLLGKGNVRDKLAKAGARGDLEAAGTIDKVTFAVVGQLSRGAIVVRGTIDGVPDELAKVGYGKTKLNVPDDAAGFVGVALQPMFVKLAAEAPTRGRPMFGVTERDILGAFEGVATVFIPGGTNDIDARIALRETKPIATFLDHCDEIPPLRSLGVTKDGGKCHAELPIPQLKGVTVDAWIDGKELRVLGKGVPGSGGSVSPTALGAELSHGEWSMALWGRGSLYSFGTAFTQLAQLSGRMPDEAFAGIRAMAMLEELGVGLVIDDHTARFMFGVRTVWSNPDAVVAKLVAIDPHDALTGAAKDAAKAIADGAPDSPFAADFRGGTGGAMAMTAPIGILAAVAIPAFLEYMKKSKKTEASVQLDRIGKSAKRAFNENGQFPIGKAALLPSNPLLQFGNNCCGGRGGTLAMPGPNVTNKCGVDAAAFANDPVWKQLEIAIDEPTQYQYEYESDGKTFTARAIGDLDCDAVSATWELHGSVSAAGNPMVELVKPPPGVY